MIEQWFITANAFWNVGVITLSAPIIYGTRVVMVMNRLPGNSTQNDGWILKGWNILK